MAIRSYGRVGGCADAEFNRARSRRTSRSASSASTLVEGGRIRAAGIDVSGLHGAVGLGCRCDDPAASDRRQIEEVVVTAERKESTVSDTSISITAFTGQMLEDFGIRNQEDLQKYIPAAVIEPYDMAIRGIGRNFRALGGDPGIATYLNGVYSEDFGIASTEGGLFDIERIEVLRGPQGTLYGRNAIGGAVNFINKLPTNEFEGDSARRGWKLRSDRTVRRISGPLIENILAARIVGTKRTRDGYIDDKSGNQNPDNYGDENYALSLRWTPTDNLEFNTRGNERSYRRRMGGADAAGIVNLTENGGRARSGDRQQAQHVDRSRWATAPVDTYGASVPRWSTGRIPRAPLPARRSTTGFQPGGTAIYNFTDPVTGAAVTAQRVTPGVDFGIVGREPDQQPGIRHRPVSASTCWASAT